MTLPETEETFKTALARASIPNDYARTQQKADIEVFRNFLYAKLLKCPKGELDIDNPESKPLLWLYGYFLEGLLKEMSV